MTANNLIQCLNNNPLTFREKLTIPANVNFGFEIELENINVNELERVLKRYTPAWKIKEDISLARNNSSELVSPVMKNTKDTWLMLKKIGELLQKYNPVFNNCSFQINFDDSLLPSEEDKIKFLKLFSMYEDIIYRFSLGTDYEYRFTTEMYAYPIALELKSFLNEEEYIVEKFSDQKRSGINYKLYPKKLIEFRSPNGTVNPLLWQNYVTFFYYLIEYSKSSKCSLNELNTYLEHLQDINMLQDYLNIKENKALILCNKLFTDMNDQTYFMDQYLGLK